jgi:hypothetical protein
MRSRLFYGDINRYSIPCLVTEASDQTKNGHLPSLDTVLLNEDVATLMESLFEDLSSAWASTYPLTAMNCFANIPAPRLALAVDRFGYVSPAPPSPTSPLGTVPINSH